MDYVSEVARQNTQKDHPNCNRAAKAAVGNMIKMLEQYGFEEREITLAIADAVDDHILQLAKQ
jgi:hypothetical protein